jgi:4-hydroxy-3-methylbut-2-enyl diphosphate reductase
MTVNECAVIAAELSLGAEVVRCDAVELLRGSLRRSGIAIEERPRVEHGTDLEFVFANVSASAEFALFVGGRGQVPEQARAVLADWAAVAGARTVLLASPRSFCAGVERAIEIVERALAERENPVYVRKQIVHNAHVVEDLARRGATFVEELDEVPDGATVVFSAHGVGPAVRREAERRGLGVIDGTCPLVTKVHSEARRFAARGDTVVLIGHAGHEEVEGTLGEAPESTVLVETAEDVAALEVADPEHVSYLTQTTLAVDETAEVVSALQKKFPKLRQPPTEDICYATTNRQNALRSLIDDADVVFVVGSSNSSNSIRLVEISRRNGTPAYLIDGPEDIRPEWLRGVRAVGLSAGASAPPALVDAVVSALAGLGPLEVEERKVTTETIHFGLPAAVHRQPATAGTGRRPHDLSAEMRTT